MRRESHARFCERLAVKFRQPTHPFLCGKSRRGNFLLKRKTRRDRAVAKLKEVKDELRRRMHLPIPWQGMWLRQVVTGMVTMQCRPTSRHLRPSGSMSPDSGGARFDGAVKRTARRGHGSTSWLTTSFPNPASFILGQASVLPSNTQGGSRMRESRTYGSVRGACSNGRPYRDLHGK